MRTVEETTGQMNQGRTWRWVGVLFPGCLFVPLVWIRWFSIIWLLFFVIWVLLCLWLLSLALLACASCIGRKVALSPKRRVFRLVLPSLIIPGAFFLSRQSCHSAYAFAVDVGQDIQNRLAHGGVCPRRIEGWDQSGQEYRSTTYYGKFGARYKVVYRADPAQQVFTILVPHCVEYSFVVKGGRNVELTSSFSGVDERPLDYFKKPRLF